MIVDIAQVLREPQTGRRKNLSDAQEVLLSSLCVPMTQEWDVKVVTMGRGTYTFVLTLGRASMLVKVTGAGKIVLARWSDLIEPRVQGWTAGSELYVPPSPLTFGWELPKSPKDMPEFCCKWVEETDRTVDELALLQQKSRKSFDLIADLARRGRELREKLDAVEKELREEEARFEPIMLRITELKTARKEAQ